MSARKDNGIELLSEIELQQSHSWQTYNGKQILMSIIIYLSDSYLNIAIGGGVLRTSPKRETCDTHKCQRWA